MKKKRINALPVLRYARVMHLPITFKQNLSFFLFKHSELVYENQINFTMINPTLLYFEKLTFGKYCIFINLLF